MDALLEKYPEWDDIETFVLGDAGSVFGECRKGCHEVALVFLAVFLGCSVSREDAERALDQWLEIFGHAETRLHVNSMGQGMPRHLFRDKFRASLQECGCADIHCCAGNLLRVLTTVNIRGMKHGVRCHDVLRFGCSGDHTDPTACKADATKEGRCFFARIGPSGNYACHKDVAQPKRQLYIFKRFCEESGFDPLPGLYNVAKRRAHLVIGDQHLRGGRRHVIRVPTCQVPVVHECAADGCGCASHNGRPGFFCSWTCKRGDGPCAKPIGANATWKHHLVDSGPMQGLCIDECLTDGPNVVTATALDGSASDESSVDEDESEGESDDASLPPLDAEEEVAHAAMPHELLMEHAGGLDHCSLRAIESIVALPEEFVGDKLSDLRCLLFDNRDTAEVAMAQTLSAPAPVRVAKRAGAQPGEDTVNTLGSLRVPADASHSQWAEDFCLSKFDPDQFTVPVMPGVSDSEHTSSVGVATCVFGRSTKMKHSAMELIGLFASCGVHSAGMTGLHLKKLQFGRARAKAQKNPFADTKRPRARQLLRYGTAYIYAVGIAYGDVLFPAKYEDPEHFSFYSPNSDAMGASGNLDPKAPNRRQQPGSRSSNARLGFSVMGDLQSQQFVLNKNVEVTHRSATEGEDEDHHHVPKESNAFINTVVTRSLAEMLILALEKEFVGPNAENYPEEGLLSKELVEYRRRLVSQFESILVPSTRCAIVLHELLFKHVSTTPNHTLEHANVLVDEMGGWSFLRFGFPAGALYGAIIIACEQGSPGIKSSLTGLGCGLDSAVPKTPGFQRATFACIMIALLYARGSASQCGFPLGHCSVRQWGLPKSARPGEKLYRARRGGAVMFHALEMKNTFSAPTSDQEPLLPLMELLSTTLDMPELYLCDEDPSRALWLHFVDAYFGLENLGLVHASSATSTNPPTSKKSVPSSVRFEFLASNSPGYQALLERVGDFSDVQHLFDRARTQAANDVYGAQPRFNPVNMWNLHEYCPSNVAEYLPPDITVELQHRTGLCQECVGEEGHANCTGFCTSL